MTRLAAVDCGTNSIRLLVVDVGADGRVREINRTMEIVRLGKGVDATGELDPAAIERTRVALKNFVDVMKFEHVRDVRMVATSATRDAKNRHDFFRMTAELLGDIRPGAQAEVISGDEEAALSFRGAVADLPAQRGPFCVIDLGGGSTEFIVGHHDGRILGTHSAQMGCVRISERIMRSDPPTASEIDIARDYVAERIERAELLVPIGQARTFVGCAGTFTTLSALAQGLEYYDARAIHGSELQLDALKVLTAQIRRETSAQLAHNKVIHPGRADVLAGGTVVVDGIADMIARTGTTSSLVVSEKDILDGIIAGLKETSPTIVE